MVSAIVGCTVLVLLSVTYPATASAWSRQLVPTPANSTNASLTGVSCTSRDACTAVGSSDAEGPAVGDILLERWNGRDWSLQAAAPPVGVSPTIGGFLGLGSISCVSDTYCVAVGTDATDIQRALAESWDGSSWSVQPSASQFLGGELGTVSCSSRVACMSAGDNNFNGSPVVAQWNGRVWHGLAVHFEVVGLSCVSRTVCAYIGQPLSTTGGPEGCGATLGFWTHGRWSENLAIPCNRTSTGPVNKVSCTSASACTAAVGSVVYGWNGQRWTVERNALHSGEFFSGLSCISRKACVGVGLRRTGNTTYAFVKRWNGSRWSTVYASNMMDSELNSVSCTSATACIAVGTYFDFVNHGSAPLVVSNS
jgi:hypothetical protein